MFHPLLRFSRRKAKSEPQKKKKRKKIFFVLRHRYDLSFLNPLPRVPIRLNYTALPSESITIRCSLGDEKHVRISPSNAHSPTANLYPPAIPASIRATISSLAFSFPLFFPPSSLFRTQTHTYHFLPFFLFPHAHSHTDSPSW